MQICKQSVLTAPLQRSVAPTQKGRKKEGFRPHLQLPPTPYNETHTNTHTPTTAQRTEKNPGFPISMRHRKQRAQGPEKWQHLRVPVPFQKPILCT